LIDFKEFDTFIFDFDGTLLGSEPYHKKAHSLVLSLILQKDINLTDDEFDAYIGKSDPEIFELYKKNFGVEFDTEDMINKKVALAKNLLMDDSVPIFDYFFDLVKIKGNKKFYVVSNQHEQILFSVLEKKGIAKYFEKIVCLPQHKIKKNEFYRDLQKYIPEAKKVVIFEDDPKTLKFLCEQGYNVVAIKNQMNAQKIGDNFANIIEAD